MLLTFSRSLGPEFLQLLPCAFYTIHQELNWSVRNSLFPSPFSVFNLPVLIPVHVLLCPFISTHHHGTVIITKALILSFFFFFFAVFHCALYNSQSTVCRTPYILNLIFHGSQQLLGKEHLACPDYLVDLPNENRFSLTVLLPLALKWGSVFFILLTAACKQFFIYP